MVQQSAPAEAGRRRTHLPGVEGVWVFILADMCVFGIFFVLFVLGRRADPELFETSRNTLDSDVGGINTLILLTSSWFVALAVNAARAGRTRALPYFLAGGLVLGAAFAVLKVSEYREKLGANISLLTNDFYMYYYTLTGIHLFHVLVGCVILFILWNKARSGGGKPVNMAFLEAGASFWHMVDLLWIMLFTLLYLMR